MKGLISTLILCCVLAGSLPAGTPTPIATVIVGFGGSFFGPSSTTINQGDTVEWSNSGGFHTATDDGSAYNSPGPGGTWLFDFTFNSVGDFAYHCAIHGTAGPGGGTPGTGMVGVVHVLPPANSPTATPSFTETPSITPSFTPPPPGSTETDTPTATPTATPTLVVTSTNTPIPPPIQFSQDKTLFAPVPAKIGETICAYFDGRPSASHWTIFNSDGERVAKLDFHNEANQCWDNGAALAGIYFIHMDAQMADGSRREIRQKVVLIKP